MSAGAQGFPDYQRQVPWDGPLLVDSHLTTAASVTLGPFYVGRWAYLGIYSTNTGIPHAIDFEYWPDQAALKPVGKRRIIFDLMLFAGAQYRIPNLGPWVTITVYSISGAALNTNFRALANNRVSLPESVPYQSPLVVAAAVAIGAGATGTFPFNGIYAGPARLWFSTGVANLVVQVQAVNFTGAYETVMQASVAAATDLREPVILPPATCRLWVNNPAAVAGVFSACVQHSTSGAA